MRITVARSAGFCFGVKRALQIALETAKKNKKVYVLGDIVHNEEVVSRVSKAGVKKISRLGKGRDAVLLIRAHGACRDTIAKARSLGYLIIDATCPMVKDIHRISRKMEKRGYTVVVIGDEEHDEVRGIVGQLTNKSVVIEDRSKIPFKRIEGIKKAAVVVQSTQQMDKVIGILEILKSRIKKVEFFNTICRPTRIKQEEMKRLPLENDLMLVIGSKGSANTQRLYEIAKMLNPRSYWITGSKDIKKRWLRGVKNIGLTAGASTPESTTISVVSRLKNLCC